jgi:hypothetical protein
MHVLASRELLTVWEWGEGRHAIDRSLALLAAACPERSWEELAALPVGRRDALLLELRRKSFGSVLDVHTTCSSCFEHIEVSVEIGDLLALAGEPDTGEVAVSVSGWKVQVRLPDSNDLAAAALCSNEAEGRALLLQRCVLNASHDGRDRTPEELPPPVVEELSARLEAADPLAVIEIQSTCPSCGHVVTDDLDAGALLWSEVESEAHRLLLEVDTLARRYGWTEEEVLALGPRRRRAYLGLEM